MDYGGSFSAKRLDCSRCFWGTGGLPARIPKAPDATMAELWAFKRQANAEAQYDVRKLLQRSVRETAKKPA
jgi:hypothetical protein